MNPDQKTVAMIGLVLILFVIFGSYKSTLAGIFFTPDTGTASGASVSDVTIPSSGTNPTGTSPVLTQTTTPGAGGFNPGLGGITLPTAPLDGPPMPQTTVSVGGGGIFA